MNKFPPSSQLYERQAPDRLRAHLATAKDPPVDRSFVASLKISFCTIRRHQCTSERIVIQVLAPNERYRELKEHLDSRSRRCFFNCHAADNTGIAHRNEHRSAGVRCNPELKRHRSQLIASSSINPFHGGKVDWAKVSSSMFFMLAPSAPTAMGLTLDRRTIC